MSLADIKEKRREVEGLAKKLIETVEKNEDLLDWSAMTRYPSLNYRRIVALAKYWDVMKEAKDYVNDIFQSRLVKIGMERSKASPSFVQFMLARRHGWTETQKIEADVKGNVSFRELITGQDNSAQVERALRESDQDTADTRMTS